MRYCFGTTRSARMDGFLKKAAAQVSQFFPCSRLRQASASAFQYRVFKGICRAHDA